MVRKNKNSGAEQANESQSPLVSRRTVLRSMAIAAVGGNALLQAACSSKDDAAAKHGNDCKVDLGEAPVLSTSSADGCTAVGNNAAVTHGPLTGGVSDTRLVISARLDGPAKVRFRLTPASGEAVWSDCLSAVAEDDFAVRAVVSGLVASQTYAIVPEIDDKFDPSHGIESHTFPTAGKAAAFTFAFGSCQRQSNDPSESVSGGRTFEQIAKDPPLFFAQIGDWTYADYHFAQSLPSSGGPGAGGWGSTDKDGNNYTVFPDAIKKSYHRRLDPGYAMSKLTATTPIAHVWDDHDFAENNAHREVSGKQSDRVDAFERYLPTYPLPKSRAGVWQHFSVGHVDVWLVDMRSQRDDVTKAIITEKNPSGSGFASVTFDEPKGFTLLGSEQIDWLLDSLRCSTATWKLVFMPAEVNPYYSKFLELGAKLKLPMIVDAAGDGWAGYPTERQRILDLHAKGEVQNMVFLTGDAHHMAMHRGDKDCPPIFMAANLDIGQSPLIDMLKVVAPNHDMSLDEAWTEWWQGKGGVDEKKNGFGRVRVETTPKHKLVCEAVAYDGTVLHKMEIAAAG